MEKKVLMEKDREEMITDLCCHRVAVIDNNKR